MRQMSRNLTRYGLALVALGMSPAGALAQELGGTVANWNRGPAEIFADSDGPKPEVIGTISDQGEVSLTLPEPQSTPVTLAMLPCMNEDTVVVENADVAVFPLAQLVGVKSPGPFSPQAVIGEITLASNAELEDGKISATRQWTSSVGELEMGWQFLER